MFENLDAWVLLRVERFCHWWQRLTGLTNFWWAEKLHVIWLLCFPCWFVVFLGAHDATLKTYGCTMSVFFLSFGLLGLPKKMRWLDEMEDYYSSGRSTAHSQTLLKREDELLLRVFTWFLIPVAVILPWWTVVKTNPVLLILAYNLCGNVRDYCEIVIPLTPGKSKVRQWWEAFAVRLVPTHSSSASL